MATTPSMAVMIGMEKPAPSEKKGGKSYEGPEVKLPPGYIPPEDAQEGEDVSVLCKIRMKPDGKACIVSMDGAKYETEEEKSEKEPDVVLDSEVADVEAPDLPLKEKISRIRKKQYGN